MDYRHTRQIMATCASTKKENGYVILVNTTKTGSVSTISVNKNVNFQ